MPDKCLAPRTGEPEDFGGSTPATWEELEPGVVAQPIGVDPAVGLSATEAARLPAPNGPNARPAEMTVPGVEAFLAQYPSSMQIILVAAAIAIASILIGQVATGVAVLITARNAPGGCVSRASPRAP